MLNDLVGETKDLTTLHNYRRGPTAEEKNHVVECLLCVLTYIWSALKRILLYLYHNAIIDDLLFINPGQTSLRILAYILEASKAQTYVHVL